MPREENKMPPMTASAVMSLPQPPLRKSEEYLKAYTSYAFTAISAIAQEVGSIDFKLFKASYTKQGPETTEIFEHEVLSLLQYMNPLTTFYDQVEATQVYLELTGEAFWVILKQGTTPREVWLVRPDWVSIVPDPKEIIKHYVYTPGGSYNEKVIIPKENMIHFKYFHPLNPYRGKGSIQAAALPLDIHTFAQEWNRNFFFNSAIPGLVFTSDKKLNEKVIQRFINQWQASYGGRANTNKIAFLGNGMKMDKTTMGAKEMDFTEQQRMMRDDVLAVFKVPKTILGLTDDVNRANAEATTRAFMERVITPRMMKFVNSLTEFLLPMYTGTDSLFFDFTDPSPEDVDMKMKKYENARKYTWMTPNEIRAEENLEPMEGGDDLFAPLAGGPSPFGASSKPEEGKPEEGKPEEGEEPEEEPVEEPEEESESAGGKILKALGLRKKKAVKKKALRPFKPKPFKHMVRIPVKRLEVMQRENLEKSLTNDLTKMIGRMLKIKNGEKMQEELTKAEKKDEKAEQKVLFDEKAKDAYWRQFIDMTTEWEVEMKEKVIELFKEQEKLVLERIERDVKHWRKEVRKGKESSVIPSVADLSKIWSGVFTILIREILIEKGRYVLGFLGVGGNLDLGTDAAVDYLMNYGGELIKGINETTRDQLKVTLAEGFEYGEGVDKLRSRVEDVFKTATRSRAEMIARTESLKASNFAAVEAYKQSGVVEGKEWLAERDDRTCESCMEMDGKVVDMDGSYFEEVEYPPLHPDCRCTTIPVLLGERSSRSKI